MSEKNGKGGVRTFNLFNITVTGPGQDPVAAGQLARAFLDPLPFVNINNGLYNKQRVFGKVSPPGALQLEVAPDGTAKLRTSADGRPVVLSCRVSEASVNRAELLGRVKFVGSSDRYPEIEFVCEPEGAIETERHVPVQRSPGHAPNVVLGRGVPPPPTPPPRPEVSGKEEVSAVPPAPSPAVRPAVRVLRPQPVVPVETPKTQPNYIALAAPPLSKMVGPTRVLLGRASRAAERGEASLRELRPLLEDLDNLNLAECKAAPELLNILRVAREAAQTWTALADKFEGK